MVESFIWLKRRIRDFDFLILFSLIGISIFCTLAIYSSTIPRAGMESMYMKEIMWQLISYGCLFLFVWMDYQLLRSTISWVGYGFCLLLNVVVFLFPTVNGAHSWIMLPGFQLQPSEFLKIFLIFVLSDYMDRSQEREEPFGIKQLLVITMLVMVPFALILKQPALGQALVLLGIIGAMLILFLEKKQLAIFLSIVSILVVVIFLAKSVFPNQTISMIDHLPFMQHQKQRIIIFLDSSQDPKGTGYQVKQAEIAVGSGSLFGSGLLQGKQTNGGWIPEQWTDFIFSSIAEEFGFVGSSVLIFLFFVIIYRMIHIALTANDRFSTFFITGSIGMFAFQIFENVGMNLSLTPVAGITLPFVSYGGSSLLTDFIIIGIVESIAIRRKQFSLF